jgi:hypothetical protein
MLYASCQLGVTQMEVEDAGYNSTPSTHLYNSIDEHVELKTLYYFVAVTIGDSICIALHQGYLAIN